MVYSRTGPFVNGSAPPINSAFLNSLEDGVVDHETRLEAAEVKTAKVDTSGTVTEAVDNATKSLEFDVSRAPYGASTSKTVAENTTAVQAALDDIVLAGGATLVLPNELIEVGPLTINGDGINIRGQSRVTSGLICNTGDLFTITGGTRDNFTWQSARFEASAGHVITCSATGGVSRARITDCLLWSKSTSHGIYYQNNSLPYIEVVVDNSDLYAHNASTVPPWYVRNDNGNITNSAWRHLRLNHGNSVTVPFIHIEMDSATHYASDLTFEHLMGEQNAAGIIHLHTAEDVTIDRVVDWDATVNYADDVIFVGKSTTGQKSRRITMRHSGRRGGTLGAGVYDINLDAVYWVTLDTCRVAVRDNGTPGLITLNMPTATFTGPQPAAQMSLSGEGVGTVPLAITKNAAQTADLLDILTEAGVKLLQVDKSGNVRLAGGGGGQSFLSVGTTSFLGQIGVTPTFASQHAFTTRAIAGMNAAYRLLRAESSGGTELAYITTGGQVVSTRTLRTGSGATGARPSASGEGVGSSWFDTTLGKPIWSDGTNWVDATGAVV